MTIIEPNKNKLHFDFSTAAIIGLILLEAFLCIVFYNQSVGLSHALKENRKAIASIEIVNADFKNKLYGILDLDNAEELAAKLSLIRERKPDYLAVNQ